MPHLNQHQAGITVELGGCTPKAPLLQPSRHNVNPLPVQCPWTHNSSQLVHRQVPTWARLHWLQPHLASAVPRQYQHNHAMRQSAFVSTRLLRRPLLRDQQRSSAASQAPTAKSPDADGHCLSRGNQRLPRPGPDPLAWVKFLDAASHPLVWRARAARSCPRSTTALRDASGSIARPPNNVSEGARYRADPA